MSTTRRRHTHVRRGWMFERPLLADAIHAQGAAAARIAASNRKATAARMGLAVDVIDAICNGDERSRLRRYDEFFVACDSQFALLEHHETLAMRSAFADWSRERCEARLDEIRCELEPIADAKGKAAAMRLRHDCAESRDVLRVALKAENDRQREMIALLDRVDEIELDVRRFA